MGGCPDWSQSSLGAHSLCCFVTRRLISHIKLPPRKVPPTFYKSLYAVRKENHRGICSARMVPMTKISANGSSPIMEGSRLFLISKPSDKTSDTQAHRSCCWSLNIAQLRFSCYIDILQLSHAMRKPVFAGFMTRRNWPSQLQRLARVLKFWIEQVYVLYYLGSENKGCAGWSVHGFVRIRHKLVFSCRGSHYCFPDHAHSVQYILAIKMTRIYKPPHEKSNKMTVRPAKTQLSLGIRPVWSESSLSAWRNIGLLATPWSHSEDSDQIGRIPRLIWVFAGRKLILLVLSYRGSYVLSKSCLTFKMYQFCF